MGSKPPIWRRIEVNPDTLLEDLHMIIQISMGWMNGHLHQFIADREFYGPKNDWDDFATDYTGLKITNFLLRAGDKIRYEYDFGDSWLHEIQLEKIKEADKDTHYPICTKGKLACPPEDCGGVWGYMNLLDIISDKSHPSYEEMMDWLDGKFDPQHFDVNEVNRSLQSK